MSRRILITGGSGRLGWYVLDALKDHEIVLVLHPNDTSTQTLDLKKEYDYLLIDLTDPTDTSKLSGSDFDVVVHLAGKVGYTDRWENLYRANVLSTRNLVRNTLHVPLLVMASSTSVYGKDVNNPINEEHPTHPDTHYARSKLLSEDELIPRHLGQEEMTSVILRLSMLYGRYFKEGYKEITDSLIKRRFKYIGDGRNHIPLLHGKDAARAFKCVINRFSKLTGLTRYNISMEDPPTQEELVRTVCEMLGIDEPKSHVPTGMAKTLARIKDLSNKLKGKPTSYYEYVLKISSDRVFDVSRAKHEIGYRSLIKLKSGVRDVLKGLGYKV